MWYYLQSDEHHSAYRSVSTDFLLRKFYDNVVLILFLFSAIKANKYAKQQDEVKDDEVKDEK